MSVFLSRNMKHTVTRARRKFKGSTTVIREDLTLFNAKLLEDVARRDEVKSAWSGESRIIAILHSGRKIKVNVGSDLNNPLRSA